MEALGPPEIALAHVPGYARDGALFVGRLAGGSVNDVFRVDTGEGRFVLRVDGAAWRRPGVDRTRELLLHECAATAGFAPRIAGSWPAEGVLVTEYQEGECWRDADFADATQLTRLGERLQRLHALPCPAVASFDPLQIGKHYVSLNVHGGFAGAERWPEVIAGLAGALQQLQPGATRGCVVHGDLVAGNLLQSRARLWLLDWEYAQCGDPLLDVACVLAYYPAARQHSRELLAAAGLERQAGARLAAATYVYEALTWLWHRARGEMQAVPAAS
jgi:aminoglycoside phosphotransferase (APT) family kinase protein